MNPYQELMTLLEVKGVMSPAMKSISAVGAKIKRKEKLAAIQDEERERRKKEKVTKRAGKK